MAIEAVVGSTQERQANAACLGIVRRARVLIAEDNPALRRLLAATLEGGCEVEEAANGFELLDGATGRTPPDLIISDIRMPGFTGLEVLAGLRSPFRAGGWNTPVILITAFGDAATHREAERLGAVVFDKPFDLDDLRRCAFDLLRPVPLFGGRGGLETVPCASCGTSVIRWGGPDEVSFCPSCQDRSHPGELDEVYVDLGGGD